jgi:4-hydroxybenzoate polyprenyltransferase
MDPKLVKTLLLSAALGFLIVWIFETIRTDLSSSYWLMMLSITFLLWHQYYRLRHPATPGKTSSSKPKKK